MKLRAATNVYFHFILNLQIWFSSIVQNNDCLLNFIYRSPWYRMAIWKHLMHSKWKFFINLCTNILFLLTIMAFYIKIVLSNELKTISRESGPDLVWSFPFTHVAHNRCQKCSHLLEILWFRRLGRVCRRQDIMQIKPQSHCWFIIWS